MSSNDLRLNASVLLIVFALGSARCAARPAADHRTMSEAWRAAVADTIRTLIAQSQLAYESSDCESGADAAWLPDSPPLVHFSADDRVIHLNSRDEIVAYCNRLAQRRASTIEQIEEQTVHLLTPDAAYVVTRSRQTTQRQDGRTEITPTVETAIAARQGGRWRVMYKHLSWP